MVWGIEMRSMPKDPPYRNQKLRDLAEDAPICFRCMEINDRTVVGCHSNAIEDGHGTGQKAHDLVAACCHRCHQWIDKNWKSGGSEAFYKASYKYTVWLLREGHLVVK